MARRLEAGTYVFKCIRHDSREVVAESEPVSLAEAQRVEDVVIELPAEGDN